MSEVCKQLYDGVAMTPRRYVEQACAWAAKDYPDKNGRFRRLVRLCEKEMRRGNPNVSRDHIYTLAMMQGMDITLCDEFRFDHNMWAALSRYMLMYRPQLARVIHPKHCALDDANIDFEQIWHEQVAATFFAARTWRDAVDMCDAA